MHAYVDAVGFGAARRRESIRARLNPTAVIVMHSREAGRAFGLYA